MASSKLEDTLQDIERLIGLGMDDISIAHELGVGDAIVRAVRNKKQQRANESTGTPEKVLLTE